MRRSRLRGLDGVLLLLIVGLVAWSALDDLRGLDFGAVAPSFDLVFDTIGLFTTFGVASLAWLRYLENSTTITSSRRRHPGARGVECDPPDRPDRHLCDQLRDLPGRPGSGATLRIRRRSPDSVDPPGDRLDRVRRWPATAFGDGRPGRTDHGGAGGGRRRPTSTGPAPATRVALRLDGRSRSRTSPGPPPWKRESTG